jgi:hypothetical protein
MKLIYILGNTRSGTTFLSRALNQHPQIFTPGELTYLNKASDKAPALNDINCTCKKMEKKENCDFWPDLLREFEERGGDLEKLGSIHPDHRLEWIMACMCGYFPSLSKNFLKQNRLFFNLMEERVEASYILDTSKRFWRLLPFLHAEDFSVHILHVLKSPKNALYSRTKRSRNFWHAAIFKYLRTNGLAHWWFAGKDKYKKIRFEELVADSVTVVKDIFDWLDIAEKNLFEKEQIEFHHLRGSSGKAVTAPLEPDPRIPSADPNYSFLKRYAIKLLDKLY